MTQKYILIKKYMKQNHEIVKKIHTTQFIKKKKTVLERPSSQMSYLDHFLKESGSTTNTTHTTSSTMAVNMVSVEIDLSLF